MTKKVIVSGVGCSLVDRLYNNISFGTKVFQPYISKKQGDGGLVPGQLVFREDFEKYAGEDFIPVLEKLVKGRTYDKINIGGPGIVSMIHAAQLTTNKNCEYHFYGNVGDDNDGDFIKKLLEKTPLKTNHYNTIDSETPSTIVLSDPNYDNGNGERIFINSIAAAWNYSHTDLCDSFFNSDIVVFGGTALVPLIHDNLTQLLEKAKLNHSITIVNTVYDFRNEKVNPNQKWPLGKSDNSYINIDLLIVDNEEALRLSGTSDIMDALNFFKEKGSKAVIVTNGAKNVKIFSNSKLFGENKELDMPISKAISEELKNGKGSNGDTTGCGDNFVGGVISSIVTQLQNGISQLDIEEAVIWGIISGGTTTFYLGGMFDEIKLGDKMKMIEPYYDLYNTQK